MNQSDLISIADLSLEQIDHILERAKYFKKNKNSTMLQGKVIATLFFEPSTRTRLSFESAIMRLGGNVIGFSEATNTAVKKGESLHDTIKVISRYADAIVIRHPLEGAARLAAEAANIPVINAGDGANEHPTQTLLDLFTIKECQRRLHELHIGFVGDLKYGRTVHSLALASSLYNMRLYFISPQSLPMPESICQELKKKKIKFTFHQRMEEIIPKLDILYMTRLQKERFDPDDYERIKEHFILRPEMIKEAMPHFKILHPLPRLSEIDTKIDHTPHANYFDQAENGVYVRQALLTLILGEK
jgi:aspartate carbamoyltransferase catalytic subunit